MTNDKMVVGTLFDDSKHYASGCERRYIEQISI